MERRRLWFCCQSRIYVIEKVRSLCVTCCREDSLKNVDELPKHNWKVKCNQSNPFPGYILSLSKPTNHLYHLISFIIFSPHHFSSFKLSRITTTCRSINAELQLEKKLKNIIPEVSIHLAWTTNLFTTIKKFAAFSSFKH